MEKKKEHASPITPPTENASTNPSNQMISRSFYTYLSTPPNIDPSINLATQVMPMPFYPDFSSYMHEGHGPMPYSWFPPFLHRPNANPSPWICQGFQSLAPSSIGLNSASSSYVEEIQEPTPDLREVETLSTPSEAFATSCLRLYKTKATKVYTNFPQVIWFHCLQIQYNEINIKINHEILSSVCSCRISAYCL